MQGYSQLFVNTVKKCLQIVANIVCILCKNIVIGHKYQPFRHGLIFFSLLSNGIDVDVLLVFLFCVVVVFCFFSSIGGEVME